MLGLLKTSLDLQSRVALLYVLTAAQLTAYYQESQWLSDERRSMVMNHWLLKHGSTVSLMTRVKFTALSGEFATHLATSLSREAGLHTINEIKLALNKEYRSQVVSDMLAECERMLLKHGLAD
jgi:hypothetical protein